MLESLEARRAHKRLTKRGPPIEDRARHDTTSSLGTDCLPQIKHIVVLMMENHSYDNYFGMLSGRGDGLALNAAGSPTTSNLNAQGQQIPLAHFLGTRQKPNVPTQSWAATHIQYDNGACDGFIRSIEETLPGDDAAVAMTYWTETDLPFYYGLARSFPLATRWFSSCLGPTFPNRRFLIAGTAHGLIDDITVGMFDYPEGGTIFDLLSAHRISWRNYHNVPQWRINFKRVFQARGVNFCRIAGAVLASIFPILMKTVQSKVQATADLYPLGTLKSLNHLRTMSQLFKDIRNGTLPSVSIIDPDFGKWSEENPQDIQNGESFACQVINAVMNGPGWKDTLLIWTYDEHGGYYDHVPPPAAPPPDDVPGKSPGERFWLLGLILRFTPYAKQIAVVDDGPTTYDRLGFRVPAVIVSPYSRPNYVTDTTYDHTSILKLIERKWNLPSLTLRDAAAIDPLEALDLDGPPTFIVPPKLPDSAKTVNLKVATW